MIEMKFTLEKSVIFTHLGKHVFSFYMLQRIPFLFFKNFKLDNNIYLFFALAFISTIIISLLYDYTFYKLKSLICAKIQKN